MRSKGELYHTTWICSEMRTWPKVHDHHQPSRRMPKSCTLCTAFSIVTVSQQIRTRWVFDICTLVPDTITILIYQWGQFAVSVHLPASETQWGRTPLGQAPTPLLELIKMTTETKTKLARSKGTTSLLRKHRLQADRTLRRRLKNRR